MCPLLLQSVRMSGGALRIAVPKGRRVVNLYVIAGNNTQLHQVAAQQPHYGAIMPVFAIVFFAPEMTQEP